MPGRRVPFMLTKWYCDCIAADGRAVIAYWASLAWRNVALSWQNVALYEPGEPPIVRSTLLPTKPPRTGGIYSMPALQCTIAIESRQRPFGERLFENDRGGALEWRAEAPAATVLVDLRGFPPVQGTGYAERICLSMPPWELPLRELRWGRWLDPSASRSVVWIDWRGESPRTWVFVDGTRAPAAIVTDEGLCAGAVNLRLGERRRLHARSLAEIVATIPPLGAAVPESLLALRETKWCGDAVLTEANAATQAGSAIHELAMFR